MFSNILYFIVVLLIYNLSLSRAEPSSYAHSIPALIAMWGLYAVGCRREFRALAIRLSSQGHSGSLEGYQRAIGRLSVLAVVFFGCAVFFFHLKALLLHIPGLSGFSSIQGILAVSYFILHLCTMWYFAYHTYCELFMVDMERKNYVISHLRMNLPILFPWIAVSLLYDLIGLVYPSGASALTERLEGSIVFFAAFLLVLMAFMPKLIQSWWGCRPFEESDKKRLLEGFLREKAFRYRALLRWPLLEGKTLTAGIMGIVSRYRYILVTDSLFESLSLDELKAVLAHEMGHARYRHLILYVVFFVGYAVMSYGMFDIFLYLVSGIPFLSDIITSDPDSAGEIAYLVISLPMLAVMVVYFRYVMGFFMRNFERQADLYSASVMGTASPIVSSLEKIAYLGGRSRDLPSWHHFSIRERVDVLRRFLSEPDLLKRHNRFVAGALGVYLLCVAGLSYGFNSEPVRKWMVGGLVIRTMERKIMEEPKNIVLQQGLAMIYHEMGRQRDAAEVYEKILKERPDHAIALNNLAWILATSDDLEIRDPSRALKLARAAAALDRSAVVLDTLAEACYINGLHEEALAAIDEAISIARDKKEYYLSQREKILK
jgi:Zn-dependent protease with chaperone function